MKVAILTCFQEFMPGYSLTGIVRDQVRMLTRHGHDVHLFVQEQFNDKAHPVPMPDFAATGQVHLHRSVPFAHLKDYQSIKQLTDEHRETARRTAAMLVEKLRDIDLVFTHDWFFTGWNLPYWLGCVEASKTLTDACWFHWVHSVPSAMKDWWDIRPHRPKHKLVFPNGTDRLVVAEQYRGAIEDVRVIHHIKDPRTWFDFSRETCELIDLVPGVMQADIVQCLPASTDRLFAKRVDVVIRIFGHIKAMGHSVCLLVANQWATGRIQRESLERYENIARDCGLEPGSDVVFTSRISGKWVAGISRQMVREIFLCSSLFVFPTDHESFGLVVPEAALCGVLLLLNKSLDMQREIAGGHALYFDFGSYNRKHHVADHEQYLRDIAHIILGRIRENETLRAKAFTRQNYNFDALYKREYLPVLSESRLWE